MKKFISESWYKFMIGSSLLMASFGFMVHSISPSMAADNNLNFNSNYRLVPTNEDGSINVKLSDEQIDRIISQNVDKSINVILSKKQITELRTPLGPQEVELVYESDGRVGSDYKKVIDSNGAIKIIELK